MMASNIEVIDEDHGARAANDKLAAQGGRTLGRGEKEYSRRGEDIGMGSGMGREAREMMLYRKEVAGCELKRNGKNRERI